METKKEKFARLAEYRINLAIQYIRLISNLSNKNAYDYSKEDIEKMIKSLKRAIKELENKFNQSSFKKFKL